MGRKTWSPPRWRVYPPRTARRPRMTEVPCGGWRLAARVHGDPGQADPEGAAGIRLLCGVCRPGREVPGQGLGPRRAATEPDRVPRQVAVKAGRLICACGH